MGFLSAMMDGVWWVGKGVQVEILLAEFKSYTSLTAAEHGLAQNTITSMPTLMHYPRVSQKDTD